MKQQLLDQIRGATQSALASNNDEHTAIVTAALASLDLERPKQASHGDFACNIAMRVAKPLGKNPRDVAQAIVAALASSSLISKAEIAGPGFINFTLAKSAKFAVVNEVLNAGEAYGLSKQFAGQQIMVEFVSANPTGPLHVGHGRQAALGDSICRLLGSQGYRVYREFYYNDAGNQIEMLAISTQARVRELQGLASADAFPESGYKGNYIIDIARDYIAQHSQDPKGDDKDAVRKFAVAALRHEQNLDLAAFEVKFDNFYLESSLYTEGKVDAAVALLQKSGKTYEEGGAMYLRTTDFGDDKDRVMRKSDGSGYTYFVPDVAYHIGKYQRGFTGAVNVQGADHHSTVTRVRAGLQAADIGIPQGYPDYVLHQMVTVLRGGEEVKISKRAGDYVTLRDLIDEAGRDATRFFFVMRKADTHLNFDLDLAKKQTDENPVFYVQYAHARVAAMQRKVQETYGALPNLPALSQADLSLLTETAEPLASAIAEYPDMLSRAAREFAPHAVVFYLTDLAKKIQSWYDTDDQSSRVLVDDEALRAARLALFTAAKQVVANGLSMLGVSAPERM
jgi:arginyl-tRNA synthetase